MGRAVDVYTRGGPILRYLTFTRPFRSHREARIFLDLPEKLFWQINGFTDVPSDISF